MSPPLPNHHAPGASSRAAEREYFGQDLEAISDAVNYHRWILHRFAPHLGRRVLEVGAGAGTITSGLVASGVESVVALNSAANMYALLQERFRSEARVTTERAYFPDVAARFPEHFDAAVYISVLEHVEHDELRALLKRTGFTPIELRYRDIARIVPWYLACVSLRQNLRGGEITLYDRYIFPLGSACEEMVLPPIGKNLLAVARKDSV